MAAYSANKSVHKTLGTTVADTVTLAAGADRVEVINHDSTELLFVALGGGATTPVASADDTEVVLPGERLNCYLPRDGVVKVVGSANKYSVIGTDRNYR